MKKIAKTEDYDAKLEVYVVRCADNSLYTGWSNDVPARIARHNAGKGSKYCRSRLPVKLVYRETCASFSTAAMREHAVKQLSKAQKEDLVARYAKREAHTA